MATPSIKIKGHGDTPQISAKMPKTASIQITKVVFMILETAIFFLALVVQWIEQRFPKPSIWVRFPARATALKAKLTNT